MAEEKKTEVTPMIYVIKLQGYLDTEWSEWLYDMAITHESDGTTTLCGPLTDQAILHSVLERIWDMNLTLINLHTLHHSHHIERPTPNKNKSDSEGETSES